MFISRRSHALGALLIGVAFAASLWMTGTALNAYALNYRWGTTQVPFYVNPANADMTQTDAETVLKTAAADWSMQSNANISFYYMGRTSDASLTMNGRNSVFFRPDSTALGQTYRWYKDGVLLEADIVIYDGSALFLPDWRACSSPQRYLHETAIHEFGHALGLGHSSVAEATMWPSVSACSTSLRTLAADDKAGIEALYKPSGTTTSAPAAPSGLAVSATSSSSITVRWTDNASNETGFAIERATAGGTYAEIARVGTNVVSYGNSSLSAGTTYSYRVRAFNSTGYSPYSNTASATTQTASITATPYGGVRAPLPGRIQFENFDDGGASVGYVDTTSGNSGGVYRTTNVDIGPTTDAGGGYYVGWTRPGEWLRYSVNVTTAGTHTLNVRVANQGTGAKFHLEVDGVNVTGSMTVPNTGGWQTYQTVSKRGIALSAGSHAVRVVMETGTIENGGLGNYNWFELVRAPLPGRIQVENFDEGASSVAYFDTTSGNSGGAYRTTNVDIGATTDAGGGYYIGWTRAGEWLRYSVSVTTGGTYTLKVRVANKGTGGRFHLEVDGVNVTGFLAVPNTGGWQTWQTVSKAGIVTVHRTACDPPRDGHGNRERRRG